MGCLKGVVLEKLKGLIKIQLETGNIFWTTPTPELVPTVRVLVGWDWTHNQPTFVKTKFEDPNIDEPDEDKLPANECYGTIDETMIDVFSMTEHSEGLEINEVNDVDDVFSIPE